MVRRDLKSSSYGALRFASDLPNDEQGLRTKLRRRLLEPIPLSRALAPRIVVREWADDRRFHFDVAIDRSLIGAIVHSREHAVHCKPMRVG